MLQLRYWMLALMLVVLFGVVGQADYENAQDDAAQYCENVKSGLWPDFNNFKKYCK